MLILAGEAWKGPGLFSPRKGSVWHWSSDTHFYRLSYYYSSSRLSLYARRCKLFQVWQPPCNLVWRCACFRLFYFSANPQITYLAIFNNYVSRQSRTFHEDCLFPRTSFIFQRNEDFSEEGIVHVRSLSRRFQLCCRFNRVKLQQEKPCTCK
jgi:hypothetical protein